MAHTHTHTLVRFSGGGLTVWGLLVWPLTLTDISIMPPAINVTVSLSKCLKPWIDYFILWPQGRHNSVEVIQKTPKSRIMMIPALSLLLTHSSNHYIRIIRLSLCDWIKFIENRKETQHRNTAQTVVLPAVFMLQQKLQSFFFFFFFFFISLNGSIFMDVLEAGPVTVLKCSGNGRKHASLPSIQSGIFTEGFFFCFPPSTVYIFWLGDWASSRQLL